MRHGRRIEHLSFSKLKTLQPDCTVADAYTTRFAEVAFAQRKKLSDIRSAQYFGFVEKRGSPARCIALCSGWLKRIDLKWRREETL